MGARGASPICKTGSDMILLGFYFLVLWVLPLYIIFMVDILTREVAAYFWQHFTTIPTPYNQHFAPDIHPHYILSVVMAGVVYTP